MKKSILLTHYGSFAPQDIPELLNVGDKYTISTKVYASKIRYVLGQPNIENPQHDWQLLDTKELREVYRQTMKAVGGVLKRPTSGLTKLEAQLQHVVFLDPLVEKALGMWNEAGDAYAYQLLYQSNILYATYLAKKTWRPALLADLISEEELESVAIASLEDALESYSGQQDARLGSYLVTASRQRVLAYIKDTKQIGMTPKYQSRLDCEVEILSLDDNEREISTNKSGATFENDYSVVTRDYHQLIGQEAVGESYALQVDFQHILAEFMATLPYRAERILASWAKEVMYGRCDGYVNLEHITKEHGIEQERIRQILQKTLKKLRYHMRFYGYGPREWTAKQVTIGKKSYVSEVQVANAMYAEKMAFEQIVRPKSLHNLRSKDSERTPSIEAWHEKRQDIVWTAQQQVRRLTTTMRQVKALQDELLQDMDPELWRSHNRMLSYIDDELAQVEDTWIILKHEIAAHKVAGYYTGVALELPLTKRAYTLISRIEKLQASLEATYQEIQNQKFRSGLDKMHN